MNEFVGWFLIGCVAYSTIIGIIAIVKALKKKKQLKKDEDEHKNEEKSAENKD